jgi:hypothetical protein
MITPVRLRLSRARGFDLQALSQATNSLPAVSCARPSKWGNPWRARHSAGGWICEATPSGMIIPARDEAEAVDLAVAHYRGWVEPHADVVRTHLRGKNLACWCRLDQPCHAEVLLEIANA